MKRCTSYTPPAILISGNSTVTRCLLWLNRYFRQNNRKLPTRHVINNQLLSFSFNYVWRVNLCVKRNYCFNVKVYGARSIKQGANLFYNRKTTNKVYWKYLIRRYCLSFYWNEYWVLHCLTGNFCANSSVN